MLFAHMMFSLATRMAAEGGLVEAQLPRSVHTVTDGRLVIGQNPASAEATARAFLDLLEAQ